MITSTFQFYNTTHILYLHPMIREDEYNPDYICHASKYYNITRKKLENVTNLSDLCIYTSFLKCKLILCSMKQLYPTNYQSADIILLLLFLFCYFYLLLHQKLFQKSLTFEAYAFCSLLRIACHPREEEHFH